MSAGFSGFSGLFSRNVRSGSCDFGSRPSLRLRANPRNPRNPRPGPRNTRHRLTSDRSAYRDRSSCDPNASHGMPKEAR